MYTLFCYWTSEQTQNTFNRFRKIEKFIFHSTRIQIAAPCWAFAFPHRNRKMKNKRKKKKEERKRRNTTLKHSQKVKMRARDSSWLDSTLVWPKRNRPEPHSHIWRCRFSLQLNELWPYPCIFIWFSRDSSVNEWLCKRLLWNFFSYSNWSKVLSTLFSLSQSCSIFLFRFFSWKKKK